MFQSLDLILMDDREDEWPWMLFHPGKEEMAPRSIGSAVIGSYGHTWPSSTQTSLWMAADSPPSYKARVVPCLKLPR